jgi:hypothetical protein
MPPVFPLLYLLHGSVVFSLKLIIPSALAIVATFGIARPAAALNPLKLMGSDLMSFS